MRKLSQITESVWSDIQDRSVGQSSRREDILDDIFKCIDTNYQVINTSDNITYKKREKIYFYIYECLGLSSYASICIYPTHITFATINTNKYKSATLKKFVADIKDELNQLYKKIMDNYSVERSEFDGLEHWYDFTVYPKDRKMTKEFCMEFIDFILDEIRDDNHWIAKTLKKKNMNESVWSDIQDRSSGESVRKEDDINNLDCEGLTDYLKKHYKPLNAFAVITNAGNIISVPIIRDHSNSCIMFSCKTKTVKMTNDIMDQVWGLLRVMENNFSIETFEGEDGKGEYKVYTILPKDGSEVTNKFFIEVIDFLLYHIPGHLYKKSIIKIDEKS